MDDAPGGVLFQVLGHFEVLVDGHAVPLGGTRQRLVLAALVANANAVVSADRLIDIVWGDGQPDSALSTLQKYVYRLRGSLGDRIMTRPPGYFLRLEAGESDASRFESLLAEATRLTTAGELSDAIATSDTALGLWRGPAWAEFADLEFARAEVARLEGLRATAIDERTEVALAAGRHAEMVGELEGTVTRYPLRERPRAQLMLALYRSGRHADALRAYDAFRRYLGDEVGLEPSASLAQLADAITLQKPELDSVPPPGARGRAALPSGMVTFLFSDIEGSTRLFRQLGHSYVELLERHRRLVRAAVAAGGGVEVNSEGDGLFFAFSSAPAALEASVSAQRALAQEEWPDGATVRVRMGLHTGEATPHDGDYVAIAVHQAARVKDAAHGGQVLLSDATATAIAEALPADCSVEGLGPFALKDFEQGVGLFEARHPSLPDGFPPPRVDVPAPVIRPLPGALGAEAERFVGRAAELAWLEVLWQRAVAGERVTAVVHGPPGVGKSRLLAEFARRAHAGGASVMYHVGTLSSLDIERGVRDGALAVLDDLDGTVIEGLAPGVPGVFLLGACRRPIAASGNMRELRGLSLEEVGILLAHKLEEVTADLTGAIHSETHGIPGQVLDVAHRLRDREAEQRVQRALERVGAATRQARLLRDEIADGVLERERLAAHAHDGAVLGTCPYKGLARYETADAPYFYGRERLVATLVARLAVDCFVGIIGASGSGKSSLVRAGLLPALAACALPGSDAWPTCIYTPGEHPLVAFAEALAPLAGIPARELARRLDRQPDEVGAVLDAAVRGRAGARVIVVVDQFEEIATLCRDPEERERFAGVLVDTVSDPTIPAVLVPVVRADYYGTLSVHPELARLFERSQLLVGAMSDAELRRAITEPARRAGLAVEDWLADAVCADAGSEPGALPLVSTALVETWVRRDGATLTLAGYREAGGVQGALARLADDVYGGLDDTGKALARRLFLRLAEPGEGTDDVRRRMPHAEFGGGSQADAVLDAFVGRRLLIADAGSVEVAHEALLREWPRLRSWLEEDRTGRRLHRQLTLSAASWDGEGRDAGALYRGTRLDAALEWAATHTHDVNTVEREFLDTSAEAHDAELREAHRTARRLRRLLTTVAAALAVSVAAAGLAVTQTTRADRARRIAQVENRELLLRGLLSQVASLRSTKLDLAALLALAAYRIAPGADTLSALIGIFTSAPGFERTVHFDAVHGYAGKLLPDGVTYATTDERQGVRLIDLRTGHQVAALPPVQATDNSDGLTALSGDGRFLALASGEAGRPSLLTVWDLTSRQRRFPDVPLRFPPGSVAFSQNGSLIAVSGGLPGDTDIRSAADGRLVASVPGLARPPGALNLVYTAALTFLPDGTLAIASQQGPLRIIDPRTGAQLHRFDGPQETSDAYLTVAPDGLSVFGSGPNGAVGWDIASGRLLWPNPAPGSCDSIVVAAVAGALLCGRVDGHVIGYDLRTGATLARSFDYQQGPVTSLQVGRGGGLLIEGGGPTLALWDLDGSGALSHLIHKGNDLVPQEFDGAGRLIVSHPTGGGSGLPLQPELVDPTSGTVIDPLAGIVAATGAAQPPGRLAAIFADGTAGFYDTTRHQRVPGVTIRLPFVPTNASGLGDTLVIYTDRQLQGFDRGGNLVPPTGSRPEGSSGLFGSPDGSRIFSFEPAGLVARYRNGQPTGAAPVADVRGVAATSSLLVVATSDGRLRVLDLHTLKPSGPELPAVVGVTYQLVLSADGNRLLVIGVDRRVRVVDMATRAFVGDPIDLGPNANIEPTIPNADLSANINAGGTQLALGTAAGIVVWDLDPGHLADAACRVAGRNLTNSEWRDHIGSLAGRTTLCPTG